VPQRSEGLASDKIRVPTFVVDSFASRGSGDSLIIVVGSSLRRPVPIRPIRSKGGVRSVDSLMLTAIPRLVSPSQNNTVRKERHHISE
jgi:hypothetical protein